MTAVISHRTVLRVAPLLFAIGLGACAEPPMSVYRTMLASAQIGYEDGFVAGFSARSRQPVRALLRLTDVYGFESRNPMRLLDADDALDEEILGDVAVVTVHRGSFERQVLFVKDPDDGDRWRVDLAELERFGRLGYDRYLEARAEAGDRPVIPPSAEAR